MPSSILSCEEYLYTAIRANKINLIGLGLQMKGPSQAIRPASEATASRVYAARMRQDALARGPHHAASDVKLIGIGGPPEGASSGAPGRRKPHPAATTAEADTGALAHVLAVWTLAPRRNTTLLLHSRCDQAQPAPFSLRCRSSLFAAIWCRTTLLFMLMAHDRSPEPTVPFLLRRLHILPLRAAGAHETQTLCIPAFHPI